MRHVRKTSACWFWVGGARNRGGYGSFTIQNRTISAHRAAYELFVGPIPEDKLVCHTCDNPSCVNFEHLFLGTDADNNLDMTKKGRHGMPRLTWKKVQEIRAKYVPRKYTLRRLASEYDVCVSTIDEIVHREIWNWSQ